MYKVAVMGDRDSIYGFASIGLDIYPVDENTNEVKLLRKLVENNYAVIYMTEALCAKMENELDVYREQPLPAIIPIPGAKGNTGIGMAMVKKSVEQAVGSDIIFKD